MISGGDVKAVQGTTGHATADMLVNTYAHIPVSYTHLDVYKRQRTGNRRFIPIPVDAELAEVHILDEIGRAHV